MQAFPFHTRTQEAHISHLCKYLQCMLSELFFGVQAHCSVLSVQERLKIKETYSVKTEVSTHGDGGVEAGRWGVAL